MKTITPPHQFPFERRCEQRIPLVISVKELSSEGTVLCLSSDISTSGMAIKRASSTMPADDEEVILEFSLPGTGRVCSVPSHYLRSKQDRRYQKGVVLFSQIPAMLASWMELAATGGLAESAIT